MREYDFQVPYLQHVLGFLGMTDIEVVDVGGTAFGADAASQAIEAASTKIAARCDERAAVAAA